MIVVVGDDRFDESDDLDHRVRVAGSLIVSHPVGPLVSHHRLRTSDCLGAAERLPSLTNATVSATVDVVPPAVVLVAHDP